MDSEQAIRIALTLVTPILTAGIGIVALVIGDWRERRTQAGRRKLAFEDASRQVDFATTWLKANREIAPQGEQQATIKAQGWLDEASELVTEAGPQPDSGEHSVTVRRLLLISPMRRRSARILRGCYYLFLGIVVLQVSGAVGAAFGNKDTLGVPDYFARGFIYADLLGIFIWTLVAMGFRFWALRAEESTTTSRRFTVRDALLLSRLTGIPANIARVVYWLWLLFTLVVIVAIVISAFTDPRSLPSNLIALIAWVGWAIGLRFWALSHSERANT